jgi:hypothetical protein
MNNGSNNAMNLIASLLIRESNSDSLLPFLHILNLEHSRKIRYLSSYVILTCVLVENDSDLNIMRTVVIYCSV